MTKIERKSPEEMNQRIGNRPAPVKGSEPVKEPESAISFFDEKRIRMNIEGFDSFTVFMRPVKIKEIPILNRIVYLQGIDPGDEQAAEMLVKLMGATLDCSSTAIPAVATSKLIDYFIQYNFGKQETDPKKAVKKRLKKNGSIGDCMDFLMSCGHSYTDILEYTIPQFHAFIETASIRTGLKKEPMSAEEGFRQLGIPVRKRGDK